MITHKSLLRLLFFAFLFCGADLFCQVAVIANKSVPIDQITGTRLFDLYSGEKKWWDNGDPVVLFDLDSDSKIKTSFYEYMGKSTSRMKSIWLKNLLSGEGDPPPALNSEEEMLKKIVSTKGAIGFVHISKVNSEVKVLSTIN